MWKIFSATAQGWRDFNEGKNNQDAQSSFTDEDMSISFICDGCHGGKNSEVGARLSAPYLVRRTKKLLSEGVNLEDLPRLLFESYLDYLVSMVETQYFDSLAEVRVFIDSYLLCTVIGLVRFKDEILLLNCGDGSFYLNESVFLVKTSPSERPTYPAYNLYKTYGFVSEDTQELVSAKDGKKTKIPEGFEVLVLSTHGIKIIGIASDGLNPYPQLFDELRMHASSDISLTLCLNRIIVIRDETTDNVTVSFLINPGG